jgi:hypothetical protein
MEEKIKLSVRGELVEIYDSLSPARLDYETREEYLLRRKILKDLEKAKKKTRNMIFVSNSLIPAMTPEGKVLMDKTTKQPKWIGISKGKSYIKTNETRTEES